MRFWKSALIGIGSVLALGAFLVVGMATFFWWVDRPTGTLAEASARVRAHRNDIRRLSEIVGRDPALGWVNPGSDPKYMTQENGPLTRQTIADYGAVSTLLARSDFRDLAIVRDKGPSHALIFMRFVVFGPGLFRSSKPVLAEWAMTPERLDHSPGRSCVAVNDGWFVCPTDP